ncbi:MAG: ammonium transporter [bacterium]
MLEAAVQDDAGAGAVTSNVKSEHSGVDIAWTIVCAFLVFFMQAGFSLVEAGLTRAKNAVNIIMKNLMDFSLGSLAFFMLGFGLMFGHGNLFGTDLFFLKGVSGNDWGFTFFIFQLVFAGTAATIVSGAMAERTKFSSYLIYSFLVSLLIYPIFGHWAWGSLLDGTSWLGNLKTGAFVDFAGSTVVHSIGGWLALAGAIVLGPRIGKYGPDGKPRALLGHNLIFAALGVFILWFGWFGFNPGSTNVADGSVGRIAVTTNLAAALGAIGALVTSKIVFKKWEATMTMNGALAGLVAITAPCYTVTPVGACLIGLLAGIIVVFSVLFFDRVLKVDDPVGAISVHGVCGAFGTLSAGLFGAEQVLGIGDANTGLFYGGGFNQCISQLTGIGTAFAWAFGLGMVMFLGITYTIGLRVTEEEELRGLDIDEHGNEAYNGFQIFNNQ